MPDPIVVRNLRDSYVDEKFPKRNFNSVNRLKLNATAAREMYSFLYWARPFPLGATIVSAKLRVWNVEAWGGTVQLAAQRLNKTWAASRINFDNQPGATPTEHLAQKTNTPAGTMWEMDITSMMQFVANGGAWYGVRVKASGGLRNLYSMQAGNLAVRPQLVVEWSDAPTAPDELAPDNNRAVDNPRPLLSYTFTDVAGDTTLAAHQIQLSTTPAFSSTVFDSGWQVTEDAEFDLATSGYAGLGSGGTIYWRVRVRDGAGLESAWSVPAQFSYAPKGTLNADQTFGFKTIGGEANVAYIEDTTPPIFWSLTGRTQTAYRVQIFDTRDETKPVFDTRKVTSGVQSIDTSKKVVGATNRPYRFKLYVWDDVTRERNGSSPVAYLYERLFYYSPNNNNTSPTLNRIAPDYPWPWINIEFSRSTPPDSFTVIRDDEVVEDKLDPGALNIGGNSYRYLDRTAAPRVNHTWKVVANVNGKDSQPSNERTGNSKPSITWLMNPDSSSPICLLKSGERAPIVDAQSNSFQETHQPINGGSPILVTQFIAGFEGHVDAVLADGIVDGLSAREMRNRFKTWKRNPGTRLLLYMVDEVLTIIPYNMTYRPRAKAGQILYDVSFDFFEDRD